ncbi:aminotransferase class I/II-fold pyridoxal phosphate-dependent enzyme [Nocardia stercoris]|uniref:Ornithine decarboxylase n=1 Tax=Nocardia stercoris TaxID=2483361 RepID=A0A3M2KYN6_9NOCA|nr:beta-eliminating lyase-related protein [Nocardia stercoris]RMI30224.1 ornithine decarboxylase [Nocardia stercoris]
MTSSSEARADGSHAAAGIDLPAYNSIGQLRSDIWWHIADAARRLAAPGHSAETDVLRALERDLDATDLLEPYFSYPGERLLNHAHRLAETGQYADLGRLAETVGRGLVGAASLVAASLGGPNRPEVAAGERAADHRPYFDVLVVADLTAGEEQRLREEVVAVRRARDESIYDVVVAPSAEDALLAVLINPRIQAVVVRSDLRTCSARDRSLLGQLVSTVDLAGFDRLDTAARVSTLACELRSLRPELDLYLVDNASIELLAAQLGRHFDSVFLQQEDVLDLHLTILRGVARRQRTPFFSALTDYARKPTGVFHAMPISRGNSVVNSQWIADMGEFYGLNIFLAETSSTAGGLDSLLEPHGPIREAQELAARAFGARRTYFVTNGTSTANKIVTQAVVAPGDVVLVDRNCHKSHHYAQVQAGSRVTYLDSYPLDEYAMYGAVPLADIKRILLTYRAAGRLDQVRMITLTNCTFDGVVYDVERVMTECLAIKPDLVFLWDEAWFAFARFHPIYRRRTAMEVAATLARRFATPEYRDEFRRRSAELAGVPDDDLVHERLLPDPDRVRIRVYATQSTHKTLTALRQGSMIHVFDDDFDGRTEGAFLEAYMTHTSTSPNYQILASLDVGRRQVELEGFELVARQVELAMTLRDRIAQDPLLSKYFRVLGSAELIPDRYRAGGPCPLYAGPVAMDRAWQSDEFVLDPCRLTLEIGATGFDGDTFKHEQLMDRWGIQVNKTTRNTVLAMTNIGTTRTAVAYLLRALVGIAEDLEARAGHRGPAAEPEFERRVRALTHDHAPLPDFSRFQDAFRTDPGGATPDGDMRTAYYLAYDNDCCEHLSTDRIRERLAAGQPVVSATFVTPYPPGFPVLVPGQEFSTDILDFMDALDTKEIHGLDPSQGYRVFTAATLAAVGADAGTP